MKRTTTRPIAAILPLLAILASAGALSGAAADETGSPQPHLVINEVLAVNVACLADPQGQFDDWIEIYNAGDVPVDPAGMWLSDDADESTKWCFPDGTAPIAPGGYLLVWVDEDTTAAGLHAGFRLSSSGEEVHLFAPDGKTTIDSLTFGQQSADVSFGRWPDGSDTLTFFATPTPGQPNAEGYEGEVAPLHFSHERGFYGAPFDLTITESTPDAEIIYTLDGRVPNDLRYRIVPGREYTGPIHIGRTTCVRAFAVKPGWKSTPIYTYTYVLDAPATVKSLPMISLVGDEATTFYEPDGVMAIVGGTYTGGVWSPSGAGSYNNMLDRELERPVSAEWILPDNSEGFQIDCGLRVHGSNYTRPRYRRQNGEWTTMTGKISLRLYFRGEYGRDRLDYPLFPRLDAQEHARVILRAGHNDWRNPFIKDELLRRLHRDMGQAACAGTFANLFINGEYKGYYNPTEQVTDESCRQWFDSDQPWDVMTMNGVRDGNTDSWNAMLNYARSHNLADAGFYAEMCKKLDVVCFIDYLIIRLWPNDWDWPQNNWAAACERSATGQWKFFLWDAEGTFEDRPVQQDRFPALNSESNANGVLYRALKANASFRMLFADRLYKHFYNNGALTTENVQQRFDEMRDLLKGVIPNMQATLRDTWIPQRLSYFIGNCTREGVYTFDGPAFTVNGIAQHGGHVSTGGLLQMVSSRQGTPIYCTVDGNDPAAPWLPARSEMVTLLPVDAPKRFVVPSRRGMGDWRGAQPYDDSAWIVSAGAPGGIGYERSAGYESYITTDIGDLMYGVNASCLIRIPFSVDVDRTRLDALTLRMQYDDGFVAYLNGVEVARRNADGDPAWNSAASAGRADADAVIFEPIDISSHLDKLQQGDNMLAIQGLNSSTTSSDFLIGVELDAVFEPPTSAADVSADALLFRDPIVLSRSTHVKARVRSDGIWSALAEATFAVGPVAQTLRISEIMYHPADPNTEYIELTNVGTETINLSEVRFTDGVDFVFPSWQLDPAGYCLVVQDMQAFEAKYGAALPCAGQYAGSLNNAGERIELQDAAGSVIHAFEFGDDWHDVTDGAGFSLTVRDPVTADPNEWGDSRLWRPSAVAGGSPGFDDAADVAASGGVIINELLANAIDGTSDWIELCNTSDRAVSVGGWRLSDDADEPARYEIAPRATIPPHGFLVLTQDAHFGNADDPGCHSPFALSRDGETLYLYSASNGRLTGYSDRVEFGASEPGATFGRYLLSTGDFDLALTSEPTPGGENARPQVGPVVLTEIMYHPDEPADAEYIELFNASDAAATLYDTAAGAPWRLTGGVEVLFPEDAPVTLAAGQYLLLVRDRLMCESRYSIPSSVEVIQWTESKLDNAGETIVLSRPGHLDDQGVRQWIGVDRVAFSDGMHPEDFSGGVDPWPIEADGRGQALTRISPSLYGNDPGNWKAAAPSPGTISRRGGR